MSSPYGLMSNQLNDAEITEPDFAGDFFKHPQMIPGLQFANRLCGATACFTPVCVLLTCTDAIIDPRINGLAGGGGPGPLSGITSARRGRQGSGQTALTSS